MSLFFNSDVLNFQNFKKKLQDIGQTAVCVMRVVQGKKMNQCCNGKRMRY